MTKKNMTWRFKLVASALVMILLGTPLSAVASCRLHMASAEHCKPHCPMTSGNPPSATMQEAPANYSCCQVSAAARPTPAAMAQVPGVSGYVAPTLIALALEIPAVLTRAEPPDPFARASCPSIQSVFCTFLI